ncbi:hypothetical protein [Moorena sp. SIO3B2]|uniref:hypothetical protein n=1 Tax=Moorena sp. SIO3B2 TaxID=2607827 RepID=UPI0013CBBEA7|nr:hypothetical protein [Moorena sp. SIO3B2]NEP32699.1 hypothetical protein [Moorena sp. SIO3B2]
MSHLAKQHYLKAGNRLWNQMLKFYGVSIQPSAVSRQPSALSRQPSAVSPQHYSNAYLLS